MQARAAISTAQAIFGADRVSLDLIYGRSASHAVDEWRGELRGALAELDVSHVSCYQLTIEKGTPYARAGHQVPRDQLVGGH